MKTTAEVLMKPGEATLVELGEALLRCGNAEEANAGMAELHRRDLHAQDMESALEMACADLNTSGEHGGPVFARGSIAEHYISWATAARERTAQRKRGET